MPALLADSWGHHDGAGPFGWVMMILLLIAVVAGIVALVSWLAGGRSPGPQTSGTAPSAGPREDDALATLRMRYARGEVGRDEFLQVSRDLGAPVPDEPSRPAG